MSFPCVVWEKDPLHRAYLQQLYQEAGFSVTVQQGYQPLRDALRQHSAYPVLVVMCIHNHEPLKYIQSLQRLAPFAALLVLSSVQDFETATLAFEAGADAYLTQPFLPGELIQKSRALLSLAQRLVHNSREHRDAPTATYGPMVFFPGSREVHIGRQSLQLSQREFALLSYFGQHANRELTRLEICRALWNDDAIAGTRRLDNLVLQLRKKLAKTKQVSIETCYGRGYILHLISE
ncbi:MAG: response regulator transcription factor [Deltaproteobacteria bacterium]|nr:MAG: response regulator transcription factor [Deltaproteobacteria bacterium]